MKPLLKIFAAGLFLAFLMTGNRHELQAQPKLEFEIKKPDSFANRQLGSEKFANRKFTLLRRAFQNTYTRYNYVFNANEKINEIIRYAKEFQKDDFTTLLPFRSYDLEVTSRSGDIDSILNTATAGILLHDLRNDWIDDCYLLMGKAYFLRQDFDSAYMVFQFLNYSFAPKEEGGYSIPIGSNASQSGNALEVASPESGNIIKKALIGNPSRNEALVWMVNTYLEAGELWDAAALITTLLQDPTFPQRLQADLYRSNAQFHYLNQQWDSAAHNLETTLNLSGGQKNEHSRDWFLVGQLYQKAGKNELAVEAFQKSYKATLDPVMDVYARLNEIRLKKAEHPEIIDQSIADLLSMARKDRFYRYRDIIYYAAGLFEMERNGYDKADDYLQKSITFNANNPEQRSLSFLLLADARYGAERYGAAYMPYDSVTLSGISTFDSAKVVWRKPATAIIYHADNMRYLQDSLLEVAAMPEIQRVAYVRDLSRRLRKELGIKDNIENIGLAGATMGRNQQNAQLFASGGKTFYFADPVLRANGFNTFRQIWGDRPNQDNWRRSSAIAQNVPQLTVQGGQQSDAATTLLAGFDAETYDSADVSFDNLYSRLPLSEEKMNAAKLKVAKALLAKARALQNQIENYPMAIRVYDSIFLYLDTGDIAAEALYGMMYTYEKLGDAAGANRAKQLLTNNFGQTPFAVKALQPPKKVEQNPTGDPAITGEYVRAYNLYLDGSFDEAIALKNKLDGENGESYWTPQLLYIETVHQLQTKQDSLALKNLNKIIEKFPEHGIAEKAKNIKEFLPKRREIEEYLTNLEITRAEDDKVIVVSDTKIETRRPSIDPALRTEPILTQAPKVEIDTSARVLKAINIPGKEESPYRIDPDGPQTVALVLENLDPAYVNEVHYSIANSPKRNNYRYQVQAEKHKIADKLWLVVIKSPSFTNATNAYEYIEYLKPVASSQLLNWLDGSRYKYIILPQAMLDYLSTPEQLKEYEQLLQSTFPGKF